MTSDRRPALRGPILHLAGSKERTRTRALTAGTPAWSSPCLGARAFGEAADGGGFRVVHVEDREKLGDLQHFLELAA